MSYPPQQPPPRAYHRYGQQGPQPRHAPYGQQAGYQEFGGPGEVHHHPGGDGSSGAVPPRKRGAGFVISIVVISVLVLAGAGAGVWFLAMNDDSGDTGGDPATDGPRAVTQAYIEAYESKSFASVVNNACAAYKEKHGTQTANVERTLRPYEVRATADGEPDVSGTTATAKIDLELTKDGRTERPKIEITIVKEDGQWKFCGENKG